MKIFSPYSIIRIVKQVFKRVRRSVRAWKSRVIEFLRTGVIVTQAYNRVEPYGEQSDQIDCPVVSEKFYEALDRSIKGKLSVEELSVVEKGLKANKVLRKAPECICYGHCSTR
jgi:hypothetical protein